MRAKSVWFSAGGAFHWGTFFCDLYYQSDDEPRNHPLFSLFLLIWDDVTERAKMLFTGCDSWGPDNYDEKMESHLREIFRVNRRTKKK